MKVLIYLIFDALIAFLLFQKLTEAKESFAKDPTDKNRVLVRNLKISLGIVVTFGLITLSIFLGVLQLIF